MLIAVMALLSTLAVACSSEENTPTPDPVASLTVSEAWLRPGIDPTAVYFTITNSGASAVTLNGADASWATDVAMHETVDDDGFLMMHHMDSVIVLAGGSVTFEPGGMHLMAENVHTEISAGDSLVLALLADTGSRIEFSAVAKAADAAVVSDDHNHEMHADSHDHGTGHDESHMDVESHGAVFASGTIPPGKTFEFTFDHSFEGMAVPYHNHLDGSSGTVMVMANAGQSHEVVVTIDGDGYHPAELHVTPGTKVVWSNTTDVAWTVINGYHPDAAR